MRGPPASLVPGRVVHQIQPSQHPEGCNFLVYCRTPRMPVANGERACPDGQTTRTGKSPSVSLQERVQSTSSAEIIHNIQKSNPQERQAYICICLFNYTNRTLQYINQVRNQVLLYQVQVVARRIVPECRQFTNPLHESLPDAFKSGPLRSSVPDPYPLENLE